ncbi:MAG: hypothetical protein ACYC25_00430 [Paludibacter sp.]
MKQKIITYFEDFKVDGKSELSIPNGYIVKQITSSSLESANHIMNASLKMPRMAITLLLEKE